MKVLKIVAITSIAFNISIIGGTIGAYFYVKTPAVQEKIKKALLVLEQKYESEWSDQELRKLAFDFNDVLDPVMGLWAKIFPSDSVFINGIKRLQEKGEFNSFEPFFDGLKIMEELGIEPGPDVGLATDWLVQLQIQEGLLSEEEVKQKLHSWWNSRTT